ncbi:NADPH-dependent FMN reductase [Aquirhabdus sp.]|uniref:NADPH-dependent FMN reductase n=1 Tax=Aquirhabdus sp. TaxID=2824160 RepID=UPI00396CE0C4
MTTRLLAFSGSTRHGSLNSQVLQTAIAGAESVAGCTVTLINLNDYPMPLYNGDDEQAHGMPETTQKLLRLFEEHDGLLLASPEYNGFFTPLIKNTFDWMTRNEPDGRNGMRVFKRYPVALLSSSPGIVGGLRSLMMVRMYLSNLNFLVLPEQVAVTGQKVHEGKITDERLEQQVFALGAGLAEWVQN